ncbi:MAG: hypothetical protein FK734_13360 [Asgard group archaeon]|nr:hypothetical protein [Asgard group archaeon]
MTEQLDSERKISKRLLFSIFLKTGRKRILLSIISGTLIFLVLTGLVMIVYTYRFQSFQAYQEDHVNWYNDGFLSASTLYLQDHPITVNDNFYNNITHEFISLTSNLIPDVKIKNYTMAYSSRFYTFRPGILEYQSQEIMGLEDDSYEVLKNCLVDGRLPTDIHEVLWYKNNITHLAINDTIELHGNHERNSEAYNYTIVGIVDQVKQTFIQANLSSDIFDWWDILNFAVYNGENRFITNYTLYKELFNNVTSYNGELAFLFDAQYDLAELKLNGLTKYIQLFPADNDPAISDFLDEEVVLCPDLKQFILDFSDFWISVTIQILSINAPLFFLIGLASVVTLNIGSKDLGSSFRRMKIYGLSYNDIRRMVLLENLMFTFVSFIGGSILGFSVSCLFTLNLESRPSNYYINFLTEPLLLIVIIGFIIGFFSLSFFIQNSIAKKTAKTTTEEYAQKRKPILSLFSTNEFRLLVLSLIFVLISAGLFLIYYFSRSTASVATGITYLTFFYFMLACSAALIITFLFLAIARLTTLFWTFISNQIWSKRLNLYSLSIRHLSVSRNSYQISILGVLIFGLVILPGLAMSVSIKENISSEAYLGMGTSNLIVPRWADPQNERDGIFTNISEIAYFTEVTVYDVSNDYTNSIYNAFIGHLLALESPLNFTLVADREYLNKTSSIDDILSLTDNNHILLNKKFARTNHLQPGDFYNTISIARYPTNLTFVNSFTSFPLLAEPIKPLFAFKTDVFSMVANKYTIDNLIEDFNASTDVRPRTMKLIKPIDESSIPIIQSKLREQNVTAITYDEFYEQLAFSIDEFSQNNLFFYGILSIITLVFVGYFTGIRVFEERGKIIESLYRVGAIRGQILRFFTLEYILINILPLIIMTLTSLPLIKYIAKYFLGYSEYYSPYRANIPAWIIFVVIVGGLLVSTIGWLIALIPSIYRFKPVKQE